MIESVIMVGKVAGAVCSVATLLALLIKPIREWLFGMDAVREGQRCLLRSEIVSIYYRNRGNKTLREYEAKNLDTCYNAYVRLRGNSFVSKLYNQMKTWEVIP